jgi:hypothetical protein
MKCKLCNKNMVKRKPYNNITTYSCSIDIPFKTAIGSTNKIKHYIVERGPVVVERAIVKNYAVDNYSGVFNYCRIYDILPVNEFDDYHQWVFVQQIETNIEIVSEMQLYNKIKSMTAFL